MTDNSTDQRASALHVSPIVVVDGDVSTQKLDALVEFGHEQDELDFKTTLDLRNRGSKKEKLELVADIAAMAADRGGYIVAGIQEISDDKGRRIAKVGFPSAHQKPFDISNLRQLIEQYVDVRIDLRVNVVTSSKGGREKFGLICIMPATEFPIVMAKDGAYGDPSAIQFAFKEGDILVRRNASTMRANQADIREIMARIGRRERERWVAEVSETGIPQVFDVLRQLAEAITGQKKGAKRRRRGVSKQLLLGSEAAFQKRFLNMLQEQDDEQD